jgi:isoquinoline 1-oxidoreductase alpha subunit
MSLYSLIINGKQQHVEAPAEKPLLWVLREDFGLKGPKCGCGVFLIQAVTR